MANSKTSSATQTTKVKGFRWAGNWVFLNLEDGEDVILGEKNAENIGVAMALKGSVIEYIVIEENVPSKNNAERTFNKVEIINIG